MNTKRWLIVTAAMIAVEIALFLSVFTTRTPIRVQDIVKDLCALLTTAEGENRLNRIKSTLITGQTELEDRI